MKAPLPALSACLLVGCWNPHAFEVAVEENGAANAQLTIYGETTSMSREGAAFVGRRENRGDGSGHITLTYEGGEQIICPIGYVTGGEAEPHRFAVQDGRCRAL